MCVNCGFFLFHKREQRSLHISTKRASLKLELQVSKGDRIDNTTPTTKQNVSTSPFPVLLLWLSSIPVSLSFLASSFQVASSGSKHQSPYLSSLMLHLLCSLLASHPSVPTTCHPAKAAPPAHQEPAHPRTPCPSQTFPYLAVPVHFKQLAHLFVLGCFSGCYSPSASEVSLISPSHTIGHHAHSQFNPAPLSLGGPQASPTLAPKWKPSQ